jgi:hypothetical protein
MFPLDLRDETNRVDAHVIWLRGGESWGVHAIFDENRLELHKFHYPAMGVLPPLRQQPMIIRRRTRALCGVFPMSDMIPIHGPAMRPSIGPSPCLHNYVDLARGENGNGTFSESAP